jgi:hypothetical protein
MRATTNLANHPAPDAEAAIFYSDVLRILNQASVPVLLGGGYALEFYTRRGRQLKDLDLFIARKDLEKVFAVLNQNGFRTTLDFPHWLGKVCHADEFIDIIFSSGNGLCEVDPLWFKYSRAGTLFGLPVRFCPPEEMIWSKSFVMERERYDGADIAHLLLAWGKRLNWQRLLFRFGEHWRVLYSHLILFDYIYPSEGRCVPQEIRREFFTRLRDEINSARDAGKYCRGTLLSRSQYEIDTVKLGYLDGRIAPEGKLSSAEAAKWTAAANTGGNEAHGVPSKRKQERREGDWSVTRQKKRSGKQDVE